MTPVLWVTPTYPWDAEPIAGIFYRTQARALVRTGQEPIVVSPVPFVPWPLGHLRLRWRHHALAPSAEIDHGVRVLRPRYPNLPGEPSWAMPDRFLARAVLGVRGRWAGARVVHGHGAIAGLAAWRVARKAALPLVLTFHGSDLNTWPDEHPERLGDLRQALADAFVVITVSEALARRVRSLSGVAAATIPLGCDHAGMAGAAMDRDLARRALGLPLEATIVLFVGSISAAKGVPELADALIELGPPFIGVFLGRGPDDGYRATDPRSSGRLMYRGQQPHIEVARYLSAADVLVLPSRSEGLPTVIVEAGSLGLPVIASAVGGIPELLAEGRGEMLETISAAAIRDALQAFAVDRPAATERARLLRAHVLDRYDVDMNAGVLTSWYRAAAETRFGHHDERVGRPRSRGEADR